MMTSAEPTCGRCQRSPHDHPSGNCPDGGGTYTFVISDEAAQWIRDNQDVPEDQLVDRYIAHLRRQRAAVDQALQPQTQRDPLIVEVPTVLTRIDAQLRADNAAAGSSKALQESLVEDNSGCKQNLLPSEVVVDLVLQYSAAMPIAGQAAVLKGSLLIATKNHLGQFVSFGIPAHFGGHPFDGDAATPPRFVLRKIGATVWKLAPSIKHDLLHAFVTIVDVPEAVTWGQQ